MHREKPEKKLFDRCCEKAQCRPEECVFIGDHLKKDVMGSLSAGMKAVWYLPSEIEGTCPEGVYLLRSFHQLPACMDAMDGEESL